MAYVQNQISGIISPQTILSALSPSQICTIPRTRNIPDTPKFRDRLGTYIFDRLGDRLGPFGDVHFLVLGPFGDVHFLALNCQ